MKAVPLSITQNLPQHFAMLSGLQRQMGVSIPIDGMIFLTFIKPKIGLRPLQTAAEILPLLWGQPGWRRRRSIYPLPNFALGVFVHIHHSSKYFIPKSKKCAKKLFHFPLICAIMSKTQ